MLALGIPKGDACYHRDARRYFRSTIKTKKMAFCFVLCSLIRTFANDHRQYVGVTFVGKTITALADYSVHLET